MFLKLKHSSLALKTFLINFPLDGETSTNYLNSFTCHFDHKIVSVDNLGEEALTRLLNDGRFFSWLFEEWLGENTNLVRCFGQGKSDFVDDFGRKYQQKLFTSGVCYLVPSGQRGVGRNFDEVEYKKYSQQWFIIVGTKKLPLVHVKIIHGKTLIKSFPRGRINPTEYESFFNLE